MVDNVSTHEIWLWKVGAVWPLKVTRSDLTYVNGLHSDSGDAAFPRQHPCYEQGFACNWTYVF